ncbi:MAG: hypothetical protein ACK5Q5_20850 [Planctomycetaceae bacterium]
MSFTVLDLPDSNAELAGWLERQLVGLDLGDVVAGLLAFRPATSDEPSLDSILSGSQSDLFEQGLGVLSDTQRQSLLRYPRRLLELQERVLLQGGSYWRQLPVTTEHQQQVQAIQTRLQETIAPASSRSTAIGGGTALRRSPWAKVLTAAAVLMVGLFGWWQLQPRPTAPSGWGWDRPGALASNLSAPEYLRLLSDGANDWFKKRPDDAAALKTRLEQFRHGCDTLLKAPHTPLAEADRDWLLERCRVWRGKIDEHIVALELGVPVSDVRDEADSTVNKLLTALRDRAAMLG